MILYLIVALLLLEVIGLSAIRRKVESVEEIVQEKSKVDAAIADGLSVRLDALFAVVNDLKQTRDDKGRYEPKPRIRATSFTAAAKEAEDRES